MSEQITTVVSALAGNSPRETKETEQAQKHTTQNMEITCDTTPGKEAQNLEDEQKLQDVLNTSERTSKANTLYSIEDSGRITFRGKDMAYFTINGVQMFTLYEIMRKLSPDSLPGTTGNRFTRLNAHRHQCSKEEIIKVKEVGGTEKNFYNCTLVARTDVERYCEKYTGMPVIRRKSGLKPFEKKSNTSNKESRQPKDVHIVINEQESMEENLEENKTNKKPSEELSQDDGSLNGEFFRFKPKQKRCKRVTSNHNTEVSKIEKTQVIKKSKSSSVKGSARKRLTSRTVHSMPEAKSLNTSKKEFEKSEVPTSVSDQQEMAQNKSKDHTSPSHKRKRRTQFELLQCYEFYTDVGPDEEKDKQQKVSDPDYVSPDELKLDLTCLDDNNNDVSEPRSPTLLLKRSQNNRWHVAKAVLPQLSFDESEVEKEVKLNKPGKSKKVMTKVKNKVKVARKRKTLPSATDGERKTKLDEYPCRLASERKFYKNSLKKGNESSQKGKISAATIRRQQVDNHEKRLHSDVEERLDVTTVNPVAKTKKIDGQNISLLTDNTDNVNKTLENTENKQDANNEGNVVKKKRRRRNTEETAFRLVETIPYPSLLVVKDNDLSPSYSMAYSENYLPGCCHPLWRWRLGRPVKVPSHSPVKTNQDEQSLEIPSHSLVKTNHDEEEEHAQSNGTDEVSTLNLKSIETKELSTINLKDNYNEVVLSTMKLQSNNDENDEGLSAIKTTKDNVSTKEDIASNVSTVPVASETNNVQ